MGEVVKLLRPIFLIFVVISGFSPALMQQNAYKTQEQCAALPGAAPDSAFDGVLVTVGADAVRAFRAGLSTTYVLAFGGGNFISAGAVSPDGRHYAVPNGIITTVTSDDVRYVVQEIRIVTTETVPRIVRRLPWRASFHAGTPFTSEGEIPPVRWLDDSTLLFMSGTISEGQMPVTVDISGDGTPEPYDGVMAGYMSPDAARGFALAGGAFTLIDAASGEGIAALPRTPSGALQIAWSPDGAQFAMTDIEDGAVALRLYDRDGDVLDTVEVLPVEQVLWNLRWSPDGGQIAFSAFDPQRLENRLHVVDLAAGTVTDTCLPLLSDVDGRGAAALAWSPDSTRIALMTRQTASTAQIQIFNVGERSRYALTAAGGRLMGWYP